MARVTSRVHVRGKNGEYAVLAPGDTVPEWATVTNPDVLEAEPTPAPAPAPEEKKDEPAPAPAAKRTRKAPASE